MELSDKELTRSPWRKGLSKYLVYTGCVFNVILAAIAISIVILLLTPKTMQEKFTVVDYQDGKVVFYLAEDMKFREAPEFAISGFNIDDDSMKYATDSYAWAFIIDSAKYDSPLCSKQNERKQMSKIVYGETPDCYRDMTPAKKLKKDVWYDVDYGVIPISKYGNDRNVRFMLKNCQDKPEETCLETTSPAPDDIEEKHRKMIDRLEKKNN